MLSAAGCAARKAVRCDKRLAERPSARPDPGALVAGPSVARTDRFAPPCPMDDHANGQIARRIAGRRAAEIDHARPGPPLSATDVAGADDRRGSRHDDRPIMRRRQRRRPHSRVAGRRVDLRAELRRWPDAFRHRKPAMIRPGGKLSGPGGGPAGWIDTLQRTQEQPQRTRPAGREPETCLMVERPARAPICTSSRARPASSRAEACYR